MLTDPLAPRGATGRRRALAQARFWLASSLVVIGAILWTRAGFAIPNNTIASGPLPLALVMLGALAYASVGLLLSLRRPEVRIGAIEAWIGVAVAALAAAWAYLALEGSRQAGTGSSIAPFVAIAAAVAITPTIAALAVGLLLLYPTDRLLSAWWRRAAWLAIAGVAMAAVGRLFRAGPVVFVGDYPNPFGAELAGLPPLLQLVGYVVLGVAAILAGASMVRRYLDGDAIERAQLRVFGGLSAIGVIVFVLFVATFFAPAIDPGIRNLIVVANIVAASLLPLALALAISRNRLWEIDHLVGRTFVYGALTAILAGLYAASVSLFQRLFVALTGEGSDAALVVTTLILATTFTPIKNRLDKTVANWTHQRKDSVPSGPGAGAISVTEADELFRSPAFAAVLDERVRAALDERDRASRPEGGPSAVSAVASAPAVSAAAVETADRQSARTLL